MVLASVNTKCTLAFKSVNPWERTPPARRQVDALLLEKLLMVRDSVGFTAITPTLGQRRLSFPAALRVFPAIRAKSNLMLDGEALISKHDYFRNKPMYISVGNQGVMFTALYSFPSSLYEH